MAGFVLMLVVDQLQGGADHMPAIEHDSDDEEALRTLTRSHSRAYSSAVQHEVPPTLSPQNTSTPAEGLRKAETLAP